jgi:hypothetical protein
LKTKRLTLEEVLLSSKQDDKGNIFIDNILVSMFYFRSGYTDKDYESEVIKVYNYIGMLERKRIN